MTRLGVLLLTCLLLSPLTAQDQATNDRAARAYRELNEEFNEAMGKFHKAFEATKTADEKKKVFETLQPRTDYYTPKFMALATRYPKSNAAVDALVWVVTHPVGGESPRAGLRDKALDLLLAEHLKDRRLGMLCTRMVHSLDEASEKFLRQASAKGPTFGIQARACASLAHNLKFRARLVRSLKDDAEAAKDYERSLGKATVARLQKGDPKTLLAESEKLFLVVSEKYGEMAHPLHGTMSELARWHLLSIRRPITLDKPSPNLVGEDLDGKKMALRDFPDKVILLDFNASYFPPCRQMLDYERKLVARLAGKPFVLIGVNGDGDKAVIRKYVKDEKITWRMWYDGGGTAGPIATRWEVDTWPTLFLIDAKGVVRSIYEGWPDAKALDTEIDKLLAEAAKKKN